MSTHVVNESSTSFVSYWDCCIPNSSASGWFTFPFQKITCKVKMLFKSSIKQNNNKFQKKQHLPTPRIIVIHCRLTHHRRWRPHRKNIMIRRDVDHTCACRLHCTRQVGGLKFRQHAQIQTAMMPKPELRWFFWENSLLNHHFWDDLC